MVGKTIVSFLHDGNGRMKFIFEDCDCNRYKSDEFKRRLRLRYGGVYLLLEVKRYFPRFEK